MGKELVCSLLFAAFLGMGTASAARPLDDETTRLPEYYWKNAKEHFDNGKWPQGKAVVDEGLRYYPDASPINEQMGRYYYHFKQYKKARYYLMHALKDDNENVSARQLLVNVEEETGNYSTAICYVNELLEVNPYWRGLWRRKIQLFRKQGNDVEADRLLRRINQIYPNDSTLRNEYAYALESNYLSTRKTDKPKAISALKEMVNNGMAKEEHYMALTNLQLQSGDVEAASLTAGMGAERLHSAALARKKAGILAGQERWAEAMTYVRSWQRSTHSSSLSKLYDGLQAEAAGAAVRQDPYVLYGRVYERNKSSEALTYLVNTSFTRNYNDDALHYIDEALRRHVGKPRGLQYKKYLVLKRMGDLLGAEKVLNKLYADAPNDYDILLELVSTRLSRADALMQTGEYGEALDYLDFVAKNAQDTETREVALRKTYNCYYNQKKYKKALATLDLINELYPLATTQDLLKRANTLEQMDEQPAALELLTAALDTCDEATRPLLADAYEEGALPYIKSLQETGATNLAYAEVKKLLEICPGSQQGLHYAVNLSLQEGDLLAHDRYLAHALAAYPDDMFFVVKKAEAYGRIQNYQAALDLLQPKISRYPNNEMLRKAYSDQGERRTLQLLKVRNNEQAMATVERALRHDSGNKQLLYTKGLVFEARRDYDSAHYYEKFYQPSMMEMPEVRHHLRSLEHRGFRNDLSVTYLQSRYTEDEITAVASIGYRYHAANKDTYGLDVNYAGRDGDADQTTSEYQVTGGMGIQLMPSWEHQFGERYTLNASAAWASKYFPKWTLNASLERHFGGDLNVGVGVGYRRFATYTKTFRFDNYLYTGEVADVNKDASATNPENWPNGWVFDKWERNSQDLFQLHVAADKMLGDFWLQSKLQGSLMGSKFYVNLSGQARFFPLEDGVSYVNVLASVGTAPEASVIDYAMPSAFSHLNALVGLSGKLLVHKNVALGLMGTWNTYYSQLNRRQGSLSQYADWVDTSYKNLFTIYAQLFIRF